jgi:hypothetical protein
LIKPNAPQTWQTSFEFLLIKDLAQPVVLMAEIHAVFLHVKSPVVSFLCRHQQPSSNGLTIRIRFSMMVFACAFEFDHSL